MDTASRLSKHVFFLSQYSTSTAVVPERVAVLTYRHVGIISHVLRFLRACAKRMFCEGWIKLGRCRLSISSDSPKHSWTRLDLHAMKLACISILVALAVCATAQTTRYPILNITIGEALPELRLLNANGNVIELDMLPAHFMVR